MCGICGIVEPEAGIDRDVLARMTASLRHRGPDDEGYHISRGSPAAGLGFRRLSIIDVAGGNQPIPNEDGSVQAMCNGEIYNFRELRSELEERGHTFRTRSDTEVLVHLYEEHGEGLLHKLNGMFALALWDERRRTLLLARDRAGEKPLYYVEAGGRLIFASEPKALLRHPLCSGELDRAALGRYLAYEYVPDPDAIFVGMRKLPAGHLLRWRDGRVFVEPYWQLEFPTTSERRSGDEWAAELRERLRESVRLRLVSDVPLGVFLSGGVDSSSIVALMAELVDPADIKTFTIAFRERSFDESAHARRVAEHLGTDHHEDVLTAESMVEILPQIAGFLDEPFADASVIPTYLLSTFARRSVTVALGGDGADELFAGYPTFSAHRIASLYHVPRPLHERVVVPLAERVPVSSDNFSLDFKLKQFLRGAGRPQPIRDQLWLGSFSPAEAQRLLGGRLEDDPYRYLRAADRELGGHRALDRLTALYFRFYLQGDILVKVDRASMATSLEVRAPFLDHTFVEFVARMPPHLKLSRLRSKHVLKLALRGRLPTETLRRGKKGFGIPVARWLKVELRPLLEDLLSSERLRRQGIFDPAPVRLLVDDHLADRRNNRKQLWTLLMFQLWHDNYMVAPTTLPAATVARP